MRPTFARWLGSDVRRHAPKVRMRPSSDRYDPVCMYDPVLQTLALQILLCSRCVGSLAMGNAIGDLGVGSLAGSRCTRRYGLGQRSASRNPRSHSTCTPRCRCKQRSASSHPERVGRTGLRGSDSCSFGFDGLQVSATVSGLLPASVILRMGHILHCT